MFAGAFAASIGKPTRQPRATPSTARDEDQDDDGGGDDDDDDDDGSRNEGAKTMSEDDDATREIARLTLRDDARAPAWPGGALPPWDVRLDEPSHVYTIHGDWAHRFHGVRSVLYTGSHTTPSAW